MYQKVIGCHVGRKKPRLADFIIKKQLQSCVLVMACLTKILDIVLDYCDIDSEKMINSNFICLVTPLCAILFYSKYSGSVEVSEVAGDEDRESDSKFSASHSSYICDCLRRVAGYTLCSIILGSEKGCDSFFSTIQKSGYRAIIDALFTAPEISIQSSITKAALLLHRKSAEVENQAAVTTFEQSLSSLRCGEAESSMEAFKGISSVDDVPGIRTFLRRVQCSLTSEKEAANTVSLGVVRVTFTSLGGEGQIGVLDWNIRSFSITVWDPAEETCDVPTIVPLFKVQTVEDKGDGGMHTLKFHVRDLPYGSFTLHLLENAGVRLWKDLVLPRLTQRNNVKYVPKRKVSQGDLVDVTIPHFQGSNSVCHDGEMQANNPALQQERSLFEILHSDDVFISNPALSKRGTVASRVASKAHAPLPSVNVPGTGEGQKVRHQREVTSGHPNSTDTPYRCDDAIVPLDMETLLTNTGAVTKLQNVVDKTEVMPAVSDAVDCSALEKLVSDFEKTEFKKMGLGSCFEDALAFRESSVQQNDGKEHEEGIVKGVQITALGKHCKVPCDNALSNSFSSHGNATGMNGDATGAHPEPHDRDCKDRGGEKFSTHLLTMPNLQVFSQEQGYRQGSIHAVPETVGAVAESTQVYNSAMEEGSCDELTVYNNTVPAGLKIKRDGDFPRGYTQMTQFRKDEGQEDERNANFQRPIVNELSFENPSSSSIPSGLRHGQRGRSIAQEFRAALTSISNPAEALKVEMLRLCRSRNVSICNKSYKSFCFEDIGRIIE